MRQRALKLICCPTCSGELAVIAIEQQTIPVPDELRSRTAGLSRDAADFTREIKEGFLACYACRRIYPIFNHVPRLFCYIPSGCRAFIDRQHVMVSQLAAEGLTLPADRPEPGEGSVQSSFTTEWGEYDYDGVIWRLDYESRLNLCLREVGLARETLPGKTFADIGCGIGVLTNLVAERLGMEVVGIDLSYAAERAARPYLQNPLVHFVQGSVFHLPLRKRSFDVGYSSGVLHHTFDTRLAFHSAAQVTKPGGRFYVWLYSAERHGIQGALSIGANMIRSVVSRMPFALQNGAVYGLTLLFWGARALLRNRLYGGSTTPYNWKQALHAARDIFTPRYANHQTRAEVTAWFREAGFNSIEALTSERTEKLKTIPVSVRADFMAGAVVRAAQR
ncbi:MAG: class I SAM-dependent methyltransferase [Acidobacteria bacterium]|nr:class I SAM-dependent methyltransferase [Acidobacteriota bacterium]MBI3658198.1 class I SAM-dependent methyltransferase [Acidobacteriota bacterium]